MEPPVQQSSKLLTNSPLAVPPFLPLFPFSFTCALWGHLLNKLIAPKPLSQGLLLGDPQTETLLYIFLFRGTSPLTYLPFTY